jgi:hypothetical protein
VDLQTIAQKMRQTNFKFGLREEEKVVQKQKAG